MKPLNKFVKPRIIPIGPKYRGKIKKDVIDAEVPRITITSLDFP